MGLIGNNFVLNTGVHLSLGDVMSRTPGNFSRYSRHCFTNSKDRASTVDSGNAIPAGHYPPATFFPAQEAGQMSMRTTGEGSFEADLIPTRPMTIDLTGAGDLEATAALVISMSVDMEGSGTLTAAIQGRVNMSVDFEGSGDLSAAMTALGNMSVDLVGSGELEATIMAYGNMAIDIVVTGTGLTVENVASAILDAVASQYNEAGSIGEKINDAGAAGNPWAALLADNNDPGTFGEHVQKLLTIAKFLGLK